MKDTPKVFLQLKVLRGNRTLIVGIGNDLKGDDAVGPFICEQLNSKTCAGLINAGTVPENYIQKIINRSPQNLLIIDAIDFGDAPGSIQLFKPEQLDTLIISTHTLSPSVFVDMICSHINVNAYFLGIQPAQVQIGQPMSPDVRQAALNLSRILIECFPPENN